MKNINRMKERMTIAKALKNVAVKTKKAGVYSEAMQTVSKETSYLHRKLQLTEYQCYIVAVLLENIGQSISAKELTEYAGTSSIFILGHQSEIERLVDRGVVNLVAGSKSDLWNMRYMASEALIHAVSYNHEIRSAIMTDITSEDMWQRVSGLLHDCDFDRISYPIMVRQVKQLLNGCRHLDFCNNVINLNLNDADMILLLIVCDCLVNNAEYYASASDYDDIIPHAAYMLIKKQFKARNSNLVSNNILEALDDNIDSFRLTNHGMKFLLDEEYVHEDVIDETTDSLSCEQMITPRLLFYNEEEQMHIERLETLLEKGNFENVQQRMRQAGLRTGFCCLFYGAPGTGKTETVIQMARRTGREIIRVDLSSQKSMWVGESEKNIERIFADYRERLTQFDLAPILLFNEADAIFSKRYVGVSSEVEQMANAMQNILLQNMESFEGILIATTNLSDNFDPAFNRRFLYKIEFKRPSEEVRKQIWLSMLPDLKECDAKLLAERYDMSGGQIENVVRKIMVELILQGHSLNFDFVLSICEDEDHKKKFIVPKLCV